MELINAYFPDLTETQKDQLVALWDLYLEWNAKINVISRKDIENLYLNHVLHSLAIAKFIQFKPETRVLDLGTGGGFPGIPLAILFPETEFILIDGIKKKITVCQAVIAALELKNAQAFQRRAEETKEKFHFVVTRAVAKVDKLIPWTQRLISNQEKNALPNGLIALKGGDLDQEVSLMPRGTYYDAVPLQAYFDEEAFAEKYLLYIQR